MNDLKPDRRQIYWRDEAMPGLRKPTDAVHAEGAATQAVLKRVVLSTEPAWGAAGA